MRPGIEWAHSKYLLNYDYMMVAAKIQESLRAGEFLDAI